MEAIKQKFQSKRFVCSIGLHNGNNIMILRYIRSYIGVVCIILGLFITNIANCANFYKANQLNLRQTNTIFNVETFGAIGDGKTDNAKAFQKAMDACTAAGGGTVFVPAGKVYLSGPFDLKSFVTLYVSAGATILASPNEKLYVNSAFGTNRGEGMIWIGGNKIKDVTLCGPGRIDGNGVSFMGKELNDSYELKPILHNEDHRPHLLTLIGSSNIQIRELNIVNSAYWTIHLAGCNNVVIDGINLLNNVKVRNSDGIDIDHCKNVRISNCQIESGDDCICLKNRREYKEFGACENIVVTNCIMTSRSCAVKIGSENMDSICHVVFDNCIVKNSNRGIGIQNRDEGSVSDIQFSNFVIESHLFSDVWWGKAEPIYITAFIRADANNKDANWRFPEGAMHGKVGPVSDIYFSNIVAKSENGVYISAESARLVHDIYFNSVHVRLKKITSIKSGVYDRRPSKVQGLIKHPTAGFYVENTDGIFMNNCSVDWLGTLPDYFGKAIDTINCKDIHNNNFLGKNAH
ncbi:glycoside hydrolase family 28 protein [Arachidicoccus sp.]|uniref:glycoside hydrolase family 28 protein n=1 Tax=Arachidicoccus sp. TaxID=1872624 RepID=UPI003D240227